MNDTIRGLPNGDFEVLRLPAIDPSMLEPGGAAPRKVGMHPALGAGYGAAPRAHGHYFKDVAKLQTIDVYRALALFNVTDPCLQHAVKKLLVAGGRGGGKDISRDIQEAIDTLARWQEMRVEEAAS